jgi:GTP-binding protein YchF
MSIDIGIVGLPQSGRTTLFNALTKGQVEGGGVSAKGKEEIHIGIARVPEPRLQQLAEILQPRKIVPASIRYIEVVSSVKDLASGTGGRLINQLAAVDALINIVRSFRDDTIPHVSGSLDIDRDIASMNLELIFSDLVVLEKRIRRIEESMKGAKAAERTILNHEMDVVTRIKASLEKEIPVREMQLLPEESKIISGFQLLTAKPMLVVINIGEDQIAGSQLIEGTMSSRYGREKCRIISLCVKLEAELEQLNEEEARELRSEYGMKESGIYRIIRESYELMGLVTFFTIASGEIKAWPVTAGTEASRAAGKIHSDMERGFIRAEVISHSELLRYKNIAEAKKHGVLRLEGHRYIIQDGDVVTFLFNV